MKATACVLVALLTAACANPTEEDPSGTIENNQTSGASDGPFRAALFEEAGKQRLSIRYIEDVDSKFLLCSQFPHQPKLSIIFVVGPEDARKSITKKMEVDCPRSWGDNGGVSNSARLTIKESDDQELWDELFPPSATGSRWYALQVAATNARGEWDSRFGNNYRLILRPE